ncbi:16S rRNA (cytosine(967)-C(5))-methyltransferase RsmB [Oceanobacillus manasiensis]|uniref:16S rRNA (cytosine(967)-C(5))-methyltransferase RsmB n=1 Tax=Oceanobacillus manasiensis TaxID=586413 RepID=UPI0005A69C09|nr:16S rRNA (cytosine(967)-C(5))-methyltransferase RsmB [Oceanobacillus manasiensis]
MNNYQLRNTILDILIRIEKDNGFSHLLIDNELRKQSIQAKDEGLLTEVVYGTMQYKLTLDYYLESFIDQRKKLDLWVHMLLRMSVYQMVYLDKIPDHAIIHEAVEIAKSRGHKGIASLVNGVLRTIQRKGVPSTSLIEDSVKRLSIETSHPEWLVGRWVNTYGFETVKEMCETNITRKHTAIRVQPLRIARNEAMDRLREEGYEVKPSSLSSQGIIVSKGNILRSSLFKKGEVTIQDQSSMLVGELLQAQSGMHVLDACSAPGGKATHIAEKMQNEGRIDAYDLHKKKAKRIEYKASDLGLSIIHASPQDARNLQDVHEVESFDRILVDAPCSGLGVMRGKPEIKYHKQEADIKRLAGIQLDILESTAPLLKKNGLLIYSTCTVEASENEGVVKSFLANNPDYIVDEDFFEELPASLKKAKGITEYGLQLFPQDEDTDGFFLTRIKKI